MNGRERDRARRRDQVRTRLGAVAGWLGEAWRRRPELRRGLIVWLVYAGLTVVMTWPLAARLSTSLAGNSSDSYINPWANWWSLKALREGLDLYHTDYIFYPQRVSLAFHSFSYVNTLLWLPLRPLGDLAAFNLTVMLGYALSGLGMYVLVKSLTRSASAGFIAGLIFAFSPHHLAEGDHPVILSTQWIPLFALFWIRLFGTGRRRQALLAALFFVLTALTSWHLMLFVAIWATVYMTYALLFERREFGSGWLPALAWFVAVSGLALGPLLYPMLHEQLTSQEPFVAVGLEQGGKGNDLIAFFVPAMRHPVWSRFFEPVYDRLGYTSGSLKRPTGYLGYGTLALALVGVALRRRRVRFWLLSALFFALLSLNSHLSLAGEVYENIQMPWAEPVAALFRHPHRFNLMVSFSVAVLAGWGWAAIRERLRGKRAVALTGLVAALILFDSLARPWPTTPVRVSAFYHRLAQEPGDWAIAAMPMGRTRAKEYMYYQTLHGKKLVEGAISRTPPGAYDFIEGQLLLARMRRGEPPNSQQIPPDEQLARLAGHNIRYIILHKARLTEDQIARWRAYLARPPVYQDDILLAFSTQE